MLIEAGLGWRRVEVEDESRAGDASQPVPILGHYVNFAEGIQDAEPGFGLNGLRIRAAAMRFQTRQLDALTNDPDWVSAMAGAGGLQDAFNATAQIAASTDEKLEMLECSLDQVAARHPIPAVAGEAEDASPAERVRHRLGDVLRTAVAETRAWLNGWYDARADPNAIGCIDLIEYVVAMVGELIDQVSLALTDTGVDLGLALGRQKSDLVEAKDGVVEAIGDVSELLAELSEDTEGWPRSTDDEESDLSDETEVPSARLRLGTHRRSTSEFEKAIRHALSTIETDVGEVLGTLGRVCAAVEALHHRDAPWLAPLLTPSPGEVRDAIDRTANAARAGLAALCGADVQSVGQRQAVDAAAVITLFAQAVYRQMSEWLRYLKSDLNRATIRIFVRPDNPDAAQLLDGVGRAAFAAVPLLKNAERLADELQGGYGARLATGIDIQSIIDFCAALDGKTSTLERLRQRLSQARRLNHVNLKSAVNEELLDWAYRIDGPDDVLVLIGASHPADLLATCTQVPGGCQVITGFRTHRTINLGRRVRSWGRSLAKGELPGFKGEIRLSGAPVAAQSAIRHELTEHGDEAAQTTAKEIRFINVPAAPVPAPGREQELAQQERDAEGCDEEQGSSGLRGYDWDSVHLFSAFFDDQKSRGVPMDEFRGYLNRRAAGENLAFLLDVEAFKLQVDDAALLVAASRIRSTYFDPNNPAELNVDASIAGAIRASVDRGEARRDVFDAAVRATRAELDNGHFLRAFKADMRRHGLI
jgi:hypothetical protein